MSQNLPSAVVSPSSACPTEPMFDLRRILEELRSGDDDPALLKAFEDAVGGNLPPLPEDPRD